MKALILAICVAIGGGDYKYRDVIFDATETPTEKNISKASTATTGETDVFVEAQSAVKDANNAATSHSFSRNMNAVWRKHSTTTKCRASNILLLCCLMVNALL